MPGSGFRLQHSTKEFRGLLALFRSRPRLGKTPPPRPLKRDTRQGARLRASNLNHRVSGTLSFFSPARKVVDRSGHRQEGAHGKAPSLPPYEWPHAAEYANGRFFRSHESAYLFFRKSRRPLNQPSRQRRGESLRCKAFFPRKQNSPGTTSKQRFLGTSTSCFQSLRCAKHRPSRAKPREKSKQVY